MTKVEQCERVRDVELRGLVPTEPRLEARGGERVRAVQCHDLPVGERVGKLSMECVVRLVEAPADRVSSRRHGEGERDVAARAHERGVGGGSRGHPCVQRT